MLTWVHKSSLSPSSFHSKISIKFYQSEGQVVELEIKYSKKEKTKTSTYFAIYFINSIYFTKSNATSKEIHLIWNNK